LALGALLVLLVSAADIAAPWPLKIIVDNVLKNKPVDSGPGEVLTFLAGSDQQRLLTAAILALVVMVAISAVADYLSTFVLDGIGERMTADLRSAIFAHLQRQSLTFHDRQRVGDLTTRITSDVDYVQEMLIAMLSVMLPNITLLGGIVVVMVMVDAQFALISLLTVPVLVVTVMTFTRRIKRASRRARKKESEVASVASETLSSMRVVQAYTREARHYTRFHARTTERLEAGLDAIRLQARLSPTVDVITASGTALILWFGAHRVLSGEMSLGLLLVFLAYLSQLYRPIRSLAKLVLVISRGQASTERVHELLSVDVRVTERADAAPAPSLRGSVALRSVTFGYEVDQPVIRDVSIEAAPGETIALAGPTGAGKSTIVSLIPRFYDPWEGEVLIDGRDARTFTLDSLRRQVALVLQDSIIFYGTIFDNIAYGADNPTPEQVLAAATIARVDEFAEALPEGYETLISERGTTLSGGQRQRIAIARALVRDAPIVILDEPTSGLDAVSERYVLAGLEALTAGRTVFVVAHRLSTLRRADRIYVVEQGRIVQRGTHARLTKRNGLYRNMHVALNDDSAIAASTNGNTAIGAAVNGTSTIEAATNGAPTNGAAANGGAAGDGAKRVPIGVTPP
jgi:subfamily B ATP-binding cassette protein MsbA